MNVNKQAAQPVDTTNSCPVCAETARRDEQLIDALQSAMNAIVAVDGFDDWRIRSVRTKAFILEAMRLLQVKKW